MGTKERFPHHMQIKETLSVAHQSVSLKLLYCAQLSVVNHEVEVNKYFRNHHKLSSLLHNMIRSVTPQLPGDTRWGSQRTSVESYIKNRPNMISVVQNHPEEFDHHIINKIMDMNLFRKAKDFLDHTIL